MATVTEAAADALLTNFYRNEGRVVTLEELEATYPRVPRQNLVNVSAVLERRGWIEHVQPAGHRLTAKGKRAYLESCNE